LHAREHCSWNDAICLQRLTFHDLPIIHSSLMSQQKRTLQETTTIHSPAEVLKAAKDFFARQTGVYAAFPEQESKTHVTLRGQGGEEVAIAVIPGNGETKVTGSTYLFDQQVARFLATLAPVPLSVTTESGE
jgi:hypothetical protein